MGEYGEPQSRNETILQNMLGEDYPMLEPQSRIEVLLQALLGELQGIENDKLNANNPTYNGALSNGRKKNTTVGAKSIAIGYNAEASGSYSVSIGYGTKVTKQHSLAFGNNCSNIGLYSFVGGNNSKCENTSIWGGCCFAFGNKVKANGEHSVAFGEESEATVNASHSLALGYKAITKERSSIALGYGVIAASFAQFVFGYYNIEDSTHDYIEIVGNGDSDSARSNARTLDISGNEWLAGNITVDGAILGNLPAIAPVYDATATYAIDDYVFYDRLLYRCTTAIDTPEAWTAAHWTQCTVMGEIKRLMS